MVKWSKPAKENLKCIHEFIATDSKYYAKKVTNDIIDRTKELNDFPKMGRIVPEIKDTNIRELFIYSYRLIYEIRHNRIEILAIIHGKRDFTTGKVFKR